MYEKRIARVELRAPKRFLSAVFLSLLGFTLTLAATGCWMLRPTESGVADLEGFGSELALKEYLADRVEALQSRSYYEFDYLMDGTSPAPGADADSGGAEETTDYSTTTLQEEGVDESDVVKNDGTYLYILSSSTLRIVQAVPADEMTVLSTTELAGAPSELYLRGDTLVAVGAQSTYMYDCWYDCGYGSGTTTVTALDVTDRSAPVVSATVEVEGTVITSRMIGPKLHLVLNVWPTLPEADGRPPILGSDVDTLIPNITVTDADGETRTDDVVLWDDIYHPVDPDGYQMTATVTWDVDAPDEPTHSVAIMANTSTVYVSPQALYLADTDYDHWGNLRETTDIYRFDLEPDGAVFVGGGSVPGRLLNRFSLGEHADHLRAATTIGNVSRSGDGDATNNVYVLHPEGGDLVITGSVEQIAPGERIYSARFLGDRGFLVTFKKVDPLFTLDLSDPTSPRVVGELKVPGYSDYIHPLGENHLLTIGKDAVDVGDFAWYQGVQISVFDVTNFAEPQRVDVEVIGERGTDSEALRNSHAFNYFASADALAVPMSIAEGADPQVPSSSGETTFRGLCLFRITTDEGIEPLAQIPTGSDDQDDYWGWYSPWTRGIFIGDYVYAVTGSEVLSLPLTDLGAAPHRLTLEP